MAQTICNVKKVVGIVTSVAGIKCFTSITSSYITLVTLIIAYVYKIVSTLITQTAILKRLTNYAIRNCTIGAI